MKSMCPDIACHLKASKQTFAMKACQVLCSTEHVSSRCQSTHLDAVHLSLLYRMRHAMHVQHSCNSPATIPSEWSPSLTVHRDSSASDSCLCRFLLLPSCPLVTAAPESADTQQGSEQGGSLPLEHSFRCFAPTAQQCRNDICYV